MPDLESRSEILRPVLPLAIVASRPSCMIFIRLCQSDAELMLRALLDSSSIRSATSYVFNLDMSLYQDRNCQRVRLAPTCSPKTGPRTAGGTTDETFFTRRRPGERFSP